MRPISFSRPALKELARLPDAIRADIRVRIARYAETGAGDVKRMSGRRAWRLRAGDYRVIFSVEDDGIRVEALGHRRDVYR